jgi:hypothetical protein
MQLFEFVLHALRLEVGECSTGDTVKQLKGSQGQSCSIGGIAYQ